MGMYRCSTHNVEYNNSCPECRVEQAETDRQSMIDALSELAENRSGDIEDLRSELQDLAHKQANPGDYTCPGCKFVTLKYEATRCPKCHCVIPSENWSAIRAEREAKAKAAAEKEALRKEAAAQEEKRARKQREAAERAAAEAKKRADDNATLLVIGLIALAVLVLVVAGLAMMVSDAFTYVRGLF